MRKTLLTVTCGMVVAAMTVAAGADQLTAQQKALAKRAAEVDCYRNLAERVMGLQINSETLVRDFVTESDIIETSVDTFIKGIRLGKPMFYEDGTCVIRGEVTYEKVIAELKKIHSAHYKGDRVRESDFESMIKRKERTVIEAEGMGAPREEPPVMDPNGTVDEPMPEAAPKPSIPSIWRQVMPQGRLMARRAAQLDAYRKLAEQLRGFKITSDTYVRDFVAESDEIATSLNTTLKGAREVRTYFYDDELICEVTMEIPWQRIIATIKTTAVKHQRDDIIKTEYFKDVEKRVEKKYYRATGMGVPPQQYMKQQAPADTVSADASVTVPDWSTKPIRAVGEAPIMTEKYASEAQARLMAQRAAELDAKRKLAEQVDGFAIQSETSVKDFVTENDEIRTQLRSTLYGAYVADTENTGETMMVTVELPGAHVWSIFADQLRLKSLKMHYETVN